MAKVFQKLNRGMNSDSALSEQPEGTYRAAINMDLSSQGSEDILNQIRSALLMDTFTISSLLADAASMNILGFCKCFAKLSGIEKEGIFVAVVSESTASVKRSWLLFTDGSTFTQIGQVSLTAQLDFPVSGAVGCFSTKDRGRSFVYFSDEQGEIRKIEMDSSVWATYSSVNDISLVSLAPSGGVVTFDSIVNNGVLISGTYQFSYSLFNSANGSYTKWSPFTNPIPAIWSQSPTLGGAVGQSTSRAIKLSVSISSSENDDFTDVRVAVVKNNTGDNEQQTIAFVFTKEITASGVMPIIYSGAESEYELTLGDIVIADAPIKTVKTLVETNNRLLAGGVTYFNRRILDDEGLLTAAAVLKETVDYEQEDDCVNKKGHFRGEVYRFGIAYHDELGNWSPVRPLDFSEYRWSDIITADVFALSGLTGAWDSISGIAVYDYITPLPAGLVFGDILRINVASVANPNYKHGTFYASTGSGSGTVSIHFDEDPTAPTFSDPFAWKCIGKSGNNGSSSDFKFPARDTRLYSILDDADLPRALGLQLTIATHPSWATGFGVFRMERDKNVIYQTPLIPAVNRIGILTPGKRRDVAPDILREENTGSNDHLAPKVLKLGAARGLTRDWSPASGQSFERVFFNNIVNNILLMDQVTLAVAVRNSEDWSIVFAPALDYLYNFNGKPLVEVPEEGTYNLNAIDYLAFINKWGESTSGGMESKGYISDKNSLHFYSSPAIDINWKIQVAPDSTIFIGSPFKKIYQTNLNIFIDFRNLKSEEIYPIVLSGSAVPLISKVTGVYDSDNIVKIATRLNDGTALSFQQVNVTNSIPPAQSTSWADLVDPQRMLALKINQRFKDPLFITAYSYNGETFGGFESLIKREVYWPLYLTDPPSTDPLEPRMADNLYGNQDMNVSIRGGAVAVTPVERDPSDINVTQSAILVNMETGKTDFRYGGSGQTQEYIFTGAYAQITNPSTPVTLSVWGGDCFISRAVFKVNQGFCFPKTYVPIPPSGGSDLHAWTGGTELVTKTGSTDNYGDFLECWIEADANAFYTSDRNRYPFKSTTPPTNGDITAPFFYDYNFGYSIGNLPNKLFSEDRGIPFIQVYPARLIYSDPRIYNSTVDGFSRFRALNFYDLDERYGPVNSLVLMNDNNTLSFQDQAIRYLPIGKSEIQDTAGNVLTVQSGEFISSVEKYLTTFYGTQSLYGAIATDMGVFCVDSRVGAIIKVAEEIGNITAKRLDNYMASNFSGGLYGDNEMAICYDERNKEIHVIACILEDQSTDDVFNWLVYNIDNDAFVSNISWSQRSDVRKDYRPRFLTSINGNQFLLHGNPLVDDFLLYRISISKWRGGSSYLNVIPNTYSVDANVEYVMNAGVDETKVFDITGTNSSKPFSKYQVTAHNESYTTETTGESTANINSRDGQTYAPQIRDASSGRLRGVMATVKIWFSNAVSPVGIYSVFNVIRKIFRQ